MHSISFMELTATRCPQSSLWGSVSDINQGRWSISLNITPALHLCGCGSSVSRTEASAAVAGGLREGHSFQAGDDRLSLGGARGATSCSTSFLTDLFLIIWS